MKKWICLLLALLLMAPAAFAAEDEIILYSWEGCFPEDVLEEFTQETGIEIVIVPYSSVDEMLVKIQSDGQYDLILGSDYALDILRKGGYLQALDKEQIPNYVNLDPAYLNQYFDPDGEYTIPYMPGSPVIVYDPSKVEGEITSFSDLWDPQFEDGLCLLDDARVMIGATLKTLGYSYNTTDEEELQQAADKLASLRPNVRVFDSSAPHQFMISGEVKAAYLFTSYAIACVMENPELKCVFPEEGVGFGIDAFVIPANASNPDGANQFLNFLCDGEIAARCNEWTMYLNVNLAAKEYLPESLTSLDALNIPEELLATKEFVEDVGETASVYQEIWETFKLS
ncbi:MAG TPA: spermidine/putrescine ABC transporter substrate-binding protein [Candidatus Pullichristensenella excrementigallinarum]|uniref:Spermidine/putrescine ABC transporter substrate-binding protein n=1 Tax=Candidatus Pullichristensenella excrementigallinarum TaxID=2840907 RepID=A0A9D1LC99_9FIRM|nr:spermidine/putrescine ABC transporter substrate-binding protein [Candidatus Pullichristensenella excrementigallinarum]